MATNTKIPKTACQVKQEKENSLDGTVVKTMADDMCVDDALK